MNNKTGCYPVSEQEKCLVALKKYIRLMEPIKNCPLSIKRWTANPIFPVFSKGRMVEPVFPVSIEGWTAGPVFHLLSTDG